MSNTVQTGLFDLIKSLSGSEKRYFKLFAAKHETGQSALYILLFDLIEEQAVYDEETLLGKEKSIKKGSISSLKNYLYDFILKSLEVFHKENSINSKISEMILQAEILFNKGLYQQCKKILVRAKSIALNHEKLQSILDIIDWQTVVANAEMDIPSFETNIKKLSAEKKEVLQQLALINECENLKSELSYRFVSQTKSVNPDELKSFVALIKKYNDPGILKTLPFNARYFLALSEILYHTLTHEPQKASASAQKMVSLLETKPQLIVDEPKRYIGQLMNQIKALIEAGELRSLPKALEKLKTSEEKFQAINKSAHMKANIFYSYYAGQLNLNAALGYFSKNVALVQEIEDGLKIYSEKLSLQKITDIRFNIAYSYFGNKEYKLSLKWASKIINESNQQSLGTLYFITKIFILFLHYELENTLLIAPGIRSIQRQYSLHEKNYAIVPKLLSLLKKLSDLTTKSDKKELCNFYLKEIKNNAPSIFQQQLLEWFDFESWIKSKIENLDFPDVIKEQAKTRYK